VEERRETFGVEPICRTLGVPVSTHYARRSRKPSRRKLKDRELLREIEAARTGYRRVYGTRKTWLELRRRGVDASRDQVARVMREHGIDHQRTPASRAVVRLTAMSSYARASFPESRSIAPSVPIVCAWPQRSPLRSWMRWLSVTRSRARARSRRRMTLTPRR
jgi:hypothetical protein